MPRPIRGALLLGVALLLILGMLGSGIGSAGQHYTAAVSNAASAVGKLVGGSASASDVSAAAAPMTASVSFEYTVGSKLADPDTQLLIAKWRSCIQVKRGSVVVVNQCSTLPQIAAVDPTLTVAAGTIVTQSCVAIVLLTARSVGTIVLTPILDIVPERISAEAGAVVFGRRPALLRVGRVQCLNGVGGEIVDGKGKIARSYEADSTTAVVEPTPTPTPTHGH